MLLDPSQKYPPAHVVSNPNRAWADKQLTTAPRWCSTDLRDGNQALQNPMSLDKKHLYFTHLLQCGFKEIEVAFPAASETDFTFVRQLIEQQRIPEDVWIQVMTQARPELIQKTMASLQGAKQAIVHVYNATAPTFREVVFNKSKAETIALAVEAVRLIKTLCDTQPDTQWCLQYSPETFCFTELDFAVEICEAVKDVWLPSEARPLILNLPTTVEVNTPNVFADQIELFIRAMSDLAHVTISIHPHNDRGTGVATAEMGLLAGATRVEGCLFGNGERTGNVDVVTLAMNLYSQGITPKLTFHDMQKTVEVAQFCNELPVHPRHPYAGELVFTAFSGSHQDAIKKGFAHRAQTKASMWRIPYLPIDPSDVGGSYEAVIRVNSQSGKSGAAWLIEQHKGLSLPKNLQIDFSEKIKAYTDKSGSEMDITAIWQQFCHAYGVTDAPKLRLITYQSEPIDGVQRLYVQLEYNGQRIDICGDGQGIVSALTDALHAAFGITFTIKDYTEHTLGESTDSDAVTYVELATNTQQQYFGVAIDQDSLCAVLQATLNAAANLLAA